MSRIGRVPLPKQIVEQLIQLEPPDRVGTVRIHNLYNLGRTHLRDLGEVNLLEDAVLEDLVG